MKILITGITGFAGYYLYNTLCTQDNEIWGIYNKTNPLEKYKNVHLVKCDITDYELTKGVINDIKPDCIYHLAAFVYVGCAEIKTEEMFNTNVIGTINLLKAVQEIVSKSRILITGSAEEYGIVEQNKMPIKEEYELRPQNLYGLSKKYQEEAGKYYNRIYGLDVVFTRTFHYFGPYQPIKYVFADFASQIVDIENSDIDCMNVGNLKAERDFTDIRDVVSAYELIMDKGQGGEVYNVCSNSAITIDEILKKYLKNSKKTIRVNIDKNKLRPLDVPKFVGNNDKLKSIGWTMNYNMDETVKEILNCRRENKAGVNK